MNPIKSIKSTLRRRVSIDIYRLTDKVNIKINLSIDIDLSNDFPTFFLSFLSIDYPGGLGDSSSSVFTFFRCPQSLGYLWFGVTLLPPNSDHVMLIWEVTIGLFVHTLMHSVECDKLHNCNLPNESSHDLDWIATRM